MLRLLRRWWFVVALLLWGGGLWALGPAPGSARFHIDGEGAPRGLEEGFEVRESNWMPFALLFVRTPQDRERLRAELERSGESAFLEAWEHYEFWHEQRAYPLADVPPQARLRAYDQIRQFGLRRGSSSLAAGNWVAMGPKPIEGGQIGLVLGTREVAGRVGDIAIDPANPNHWLVGGAQAGIWETTDGGVTWSPRTDDQPSMAMGAIAFAPGNPSVVYAGTGEATFSGSSYFGAGVLKSLDGGSTWSAIPGTADTFRGGSFSDIVVSPSDENTLLAATTPGIGGKGAVRSPNPAPTGVFRSTDGGASWSLRLSGDVTDLEVRPGNFAQMYAAKGAVLGDAANGLYRSTDAGLSWSKVPGPWDGAAGGVGRTELAIAPSDPDVMYVSVSDAINGAGNDGGMIGLYTTANAWAAIPTWTQISLRPTDNGTGTLGYCGWGDAYKAAVNQCWYDHEIIVDPANPSMLYAGGIEIWKYDGLGWSDVSNKPDVGTHVDQHAFAWAGNRLVVGNDGGVWSSGDGGATWATHNLELAFTQFYEGVAHPSGLDLAIAGSQDNGTSLWQGRDGWPSLFGGDGADAAISASDPEHDWAVSSQGLNIYRTTDGGNSFVSATGGIDRTNAPFIARFEKCPSNDDVFLAATDNLWRSDNFFSGAQATWWANGPEMGTDGQGRPNRVTAMAFAPSDPTCKTYAYGTRFGDLRLTTTGGQAWIDLDPADQVPGRYVTDLEFDPTDPNTLYVTLSGFDEGTPGKPGHLFKSLNALAATPAWSNISPPVNLPFNTVAVRPDAPANVYVGTDIALWHSPDAGGSWSFMGPGSGLPNVAVFELGFGANGGRLYAFTHGRGAFYLDFGTVSSGANLSLTGQAAPSPVAGNGELTYRLRLSNFGPQTAASSALSYALPAGASFVWASSGCAGAGGRVSCNLGDLAAGAFATVQIVVRPTATGSLSSAFTASSSTADPNLTNNSLTLDTPVVAAAGLSVLKGSNSPADKTADKGLSTPVLQFRLTNTGVAGSEDVLLEGVTLQARGSGVDSKDITGVWIYPDLNGNGQVDPGETPLASGVYGMDDGQLKLSFGPLSLAAGSSSDLLVVYAFNTTIGLWPRALQASLLPGFTPLATLLLAALLMVGLWRLRRGRGLFIAGLLLGALISACDNRPRELTYQVTLNAVSARGAGSNTPLAASGLPLEGAKITLRR